MTKQKTTIMDLRKDLTQIELDPQEKGMTSTKQRKKDKAALKLAKEVEKTKEDYVWLQMGKTSRHVHPDKVKGYLADGWKKLNVKKK
jgi:hypothetical protein